MSVLRADKILDYLASPLSKCLKDENPYVRKTAALCVAKVFDLKPELCVEYGFIDTLKDLIGDGNPMVSYYALYECKLMTGRRKCSNSPCRYPRSLTKRTTLPPKLTQRIVTSPIIPTAFINIHYRPPYALETPHGSK